MNKGLEEQRRREQAIYHMLSDDTGREALSILIDMFDGDDLRGISNEETYYKLGQRDVVRYLTNISVRGED